MFLILTTVSLTSYQISKAQCNGLKGPNLLGAKGTFSTPFITVNTTAEACASAGTNTYNPIGNVGNALVGCSTPGIAIPCSDYTYTDVYKGLFPEFRYTILKTLGDNTGTNCIRGLNGWRGKDHTGDGGYFMVVNGAPNTSNSPVFFQIKTIPVCVGATYEFSAWVLDLTPGTGTSISSPNISFKVNGITIANSGPIDATNNATWVKVGGTFTATTSNVDLQVVNATFVAGGNDLGLDDISFNVCQSQIAVIKVGSSSNCSGNNVSALFTVTDNSQNNTWYKWQKSTDGGATFIDSTIGAQATYVGNSYTLTNNIGVVNSNMNGYKYRLVVSTSQVGLSTPDCIYYNDYTLLVADCGPLPVQLTSFTGRYAGGKSILDWQTSQELNSNGFELLRSLDGENFVKVASINSIGNSNTKRNYYYQDNIGDISGNTVYYRLKQIDIDGKSTFSSIVKITLGSRLTLNIFPNPFPNNFTVAFGAIKASNANFRIQNATGLLVYSKTINVAKGNNSVLINNLPALGSGVYYVTISNDELNLNARLQKL
jgi:hypothetical protein